MSNADRDNEEKKTSNATVYWKRRRNKVLNCSLCPPHKVENSSGAKNRTWKKHRKTQYKAKEVKSGQTRCKE